VFLLVLALLMRARSQHRGFEVMFFLDPASTDARCLRCLMDRHAMPWRPRRRSCSDGGSGGDPWLGSPTPTPGLTGSYSAALWVVDRWVVGGVVMMECSAPSPFPARPVLPEAWYPFDRAATSSTAADGCIFRAWRAGPVRRS